MGRFITKSLLDGTVQFGSGLLPKGNVTDPLSDLNFISILATGLLPGEGFKPALRNDVLTSTLKVGAKVDGPQTGVYFELPELTSLAGIEKYLLNITTGTLGELVKLRLTAGVSPL